MGISQITYPNIKTTLTLPLWRHFRKSIFFDLIGGLVSKGSIIKKKKKKSDGQVNHVNKKGYFNVSGQTLRTIFILSYAKAIKENISPSVRYYVCPSQVSRIQGSQ